MPTDGRLAQEVPAALDGERLDRLLPRLVPGLSRVAARLLIERGAVTVAGKRCRKSGDRLTAGVEVTVDLGVLDERSAAEREALAGKAKDIVVLGQGPRWAVLRKPAGLGATTRHFGDTLCFSVMGRGQLAETDPGWAIAEGSEPLPDLGLVHRLDHGTSGVSLFARDAEALASFVGARRQGSLRRTYWALCTGRPSFDPGEIIDIPIAHHPTDPSRMVALEGAQLYRGEPQEARTTVTVLGSAGGCSLLELHLEGGRRHQIRVHLAHLGHPILGDGLYGPSAAARLALHALQVDFSCPDRHRPETFVAEPGDHFWAFAEALRQPTPSVSRTS